MQRDLWKTPKVRFQSSRPENLLLLLCDLNGLLETVNKVGFFYCFVFPTTTVLYGFNDATPSSTPNFLSVPLWLLL